ncbi:MAG: DUF1854 domain-containing protein [Janthinobacterium lividum]
MVATETDNPFAVRVLDPKSIRLFRTHPQDTTVRATIEGDRSWREVRIARAFPLSDPDRYIGLRDGNDKDIGMLESLSGIDGESHAIIEEELERRYFTPQITQVNYVDEAFGVVTWEVETSKGPRRFLVRNLRDSSYTLGSSRVMMTDVDGNRYEFPDARTMGPKALLVLSKIL